MIGGGNEELISQSSGIARGKPREAAQQGI